MATTKKTYTVGNVKQLIDLNGNSTNFDIQFSVISQNREPFELLVVDQTTLDNTPNLNYNRVTQGEISGKLRNDKNVYQNYFLILKAEKPCNCEVEITKQEIVPKPQQQEVIVPPMINHTAPPTNSFSWVKIGLIVAVVLIGLIFLWWFTHKNPSEQGMGDNNEINEIKVIQDDAGFKFYSPPVFKSPSPAPSSHHTPPPAQTNPLLERLKRLNL
jgi:hypothetical protein